MTKSRTDNGRFTELQIVRQSNGIGKKRQAIAPDGITSDASRLRNGLIISDVVGRPWSVMLLSCPEQ